MEVLEQGHNFCMFPVSYFLKKSEVSDQTAKKPSLIYDFAGHTSFIVVCFPNVLANITFSLQLEHDILHKLLLSEKRKHSTSVCNA